MDREKSTSHCMPPTQQCCRSRDQSWDRDRSQEYFLLVSTPWGLGLVSISHQWGLGIRRSRISRSVKNCRVQCDCCVLIDYMVFNHKTKQSQSCHPWASLDQGCCCAHLPQYPHPVPISGPRNSVHMVRQPRIGSIHVHCTARSITESWIHFWITFWGPLFFPPIFFFTILSLDKCLATGVPQVYLNQLSVPSAQLVFWCLYGLVGLLVYLVLSPR